MGRSSSPSLFCMLQVRCNPEAASLMDKASAVSWFSAGSGQSGGRGRMDQSVTASISLRCPWRLMARGVSTMKTTSCFCEPTRKFSGSSGTAVCAPMPMTFTCSETPVPGMTGMITGEATTALASIGA